MVCIGEGALEEGLSGVIREPWIGGWLGEFACLGFGDAGCLQCVRGGWDLRVVFWSAV